MLEWIVDPWEAMARWTEEAAASEPDVPEAAQLATVTADGRPRVRTVLVKWWSAQDGFGIFTNYGSRKARDLDATGVGALLFHWKSLQRQISVEGRVARASAADCDAYFATRPRGSQLGAWASEQSQPLHDRAVLERRIVEAEARFGGRDVARPPFWGGFRLVPDRFEFWQGQPDRLHHRVELTRAEGGWSRRQLYP